MKSNVELRLHVGAHKTATTHFQDLLEKNVDILDNLKCLFITRREFRKNRTIEKIAKKYSSSQNKLFFWRNCPEISDLSERYEDRIKKVLVSEEKLLGDVRSLLAGSYGGLEKRLKPWSVIAKPENTKVYVSIRNYAEILPSAYSQAVRNGARVYDFDEYLKVWIEGSFSWASLIERVKNVFPKSSVTVWTFDDYINDYDKIIRLFTGEDIPHCDLFIPSDTARLSRDQLVAVKAFLSENPHLSGRSLREKIKILIKETEFGEKYFPLSVPQKDVLTKLYYQDIEKIKRISEFVSKTS